MAELEYRNRSISQLVSELNSLGEAKVVLEPVRLLAVHEFDLQSVKRFKNSHGEQFFTVRGQDKKYLYSEIVQKMGSGQLRLLADLFEKGFHVSLLMSAPREQVKMSQLLGEITKWMGEAAYSALNFSQQQIVDLVSSSKVAEREADNPGRFYAVKEENALVFLDGVIRGLGKPGVVLIKIRKLIQNEPSSNEVNLIILPEQFFSQAGKSTEYLSVVKSQLTQIFNYIKLNPAKKYQHFSKLLTKRLPITNAVASLVLEQSLCMVVNWINEGQHLTERLAFYQKLRGISAFLKIEEGSRPEIVDLPSTFSSNTASRKQLQKSISRLKQTKTDRTPISHLLSEDNQLEYCRSFQRKTHKYSINEDNEQEEGLFSLKQNYQEPSDFNVTNNNPSPVTHHRSERLRDRIPDTVRFDQTLPKKATEHLNESEQIAVLKANHAIEISQYHQTIQQLNKKILVLSQEHQLEELYTIHERELMLLQLKIKELREDISKLCSGPDDKSFKAMVRKLNEEIKRLQTKQSEKKVSNSKVLVLEKQLQEMRKKCEESESGRKKLAYELQYLTKRLKICDAEIDHLNKRETHFNQWRSNEGPALASTAKLSLNEAESLREMEVLMQSVREGNKQASRFLMRKITNILQDLGSSRNIILNCNDFLVQLQEHLEQSFGLKEPQVVLDCNKFIRGFLMDNLHIF